MVGDGEIWWDENSMREFSLVGQIGKLPATWGIPPIWKNSEPWDKK